MGGLRFSGLAVVDSQFKAGVVLACLATAIMLGLVALALQGTPYILLEFLVFGSVASGILLLGVYIAASNLHRPRP